MRLVTILLAFIVLLPIVASDAPSRITCYVDAATGNDANAGTTPDAAWRTIQKAADTARAGDTVLIREGTYREGVRLDRHSGGEGAPIIFRALPGETVVVESPAWYGLYVQADWLVIDGLHVRGSTNHGLFLSGAHHNTIQNCEFSGHGWAGVMIGGDRGSTSHNVVQRCAVHDNAHEGIYLRSGYLNQPGIPVTNNVVQYNTIYRNGGEGIQNTATFAHPAPSSTVIRGNHVYDNDAWAAGACLEGDNLLVEDNIIRDNGGEVGGVWYADGGGGVLRNNVIHGNRGSSADHAAGIYLRNLVHTRVDHNTIHGNSGHGILVYAAGPDVAIRNNILSGNDDQLRIAKGAPSVERNLIHGESSALGIKAVRAAPAFVGPDEGNLRPMAGCAAVDAGGPVGVTRDIDGVPRPQGAGYDLGAYERPAE